MSARFLAAIAVMAFAASTSSLVASPLQAPVVRRVLRTGLTLLIRPEPGSKTISIHVLVRTDPLAVRGGEHIGPVVLHGLFYGNTNLSSRSMARAVVESGGFIQTRWEPDFAHIECLTTRAGLDEALYALAQALTGAEFGEADLRLAREAAAREAQREAEDPRRAAYAAAREVLHAEGPYRLPFAGSKARVERVSTFAARDYFRRVFTPGNTVISVGGDVDADKITGQIELKFGQYRNPGAVSLSPRKTAPLESTVAIRQIVPGKNQTLVALCPMSGPLSQDFAAAKLLAAIVGGGKANRLFRKLRDRLGAGYAIGAELAPLARESHLIAYMEMDGESGASDERKALREEFRLALQSLATEPITERELNRAKQFLKGERLVEQQRLRSRTYSPAWMEAAGAGFKADEALNEKLDAVTLEEVRRLAVTQCRHWVIASAGPATE